MPEQSEKARESRVRRALQREGETLVKVRYRHPDYWQYGPYYVVDAATNGITAYGLSLETLERDLANSTAA